MMIKGVGQTTSGTPDTGKSKDRLLKGREAWTQVSKKGRRGGGLYQGVGRDVEKHTGVLKRFGISIPQQQTVKKYFINIHHL